MTRTVIFLAFLLAVALPPGANAGEAQPPAATAPATKVEKFGAPLEPGEALSLATILEAPEAFAGKEVRVQGVVRTACTKKGCWMELAAAPGEGPACRVTFKNYGFFVPKDSAGARATLAGTVHVKTVAKKEVDHLEAEGAKFVKAEDGTAREIRIVATGVELGR